MKLKYLIPISIPFLIYLVVLILPCTDVPKNWAEWGSAFGIFNGFAFVIAMIALYMQRLENRKAEEARQKRDYANIAFEISKIFLSKEMLEDKNKIIAFWLENKDNYSQVCMKLHCELLSQIPKQNYSEKVKKFSNTEAASRKILTIHRSILALHNEGIVKDEFIKNVVSESDIHVCITMIKPINVLYPFNEVQVFNLYERLFPDFENYIEEKNKIMIERANKFIKENLKQ